MQPNDSELNRIIHFQRSVESDLQKLIEEIAKQQEHAQLESKSAQVIEELIQNLQKAPKQLEMQIAGSKAPCSGGVKAPGSFYPNA